MAATNLKKVGTGSTMVEKLIGADKKQTKKSNGRASDS